MESMNKIAFFCGCILLVLLVCPTVTANDQFDQYFNEGLNYLNLGQYSEALTSFDKVNAIDSYYPNVWNDRGLALYGLGRYSEALTSYDKALTLNQSHANAWYNRGVALYRLGRYSEAVASFDKANAINPNDSDTAYNRKIALEKQSQAQQTSATPIQQQTQSAPLMYAPIGAIVLMIGIAVRIRRRSRIS